MVASRRSTRTDESTQVDTPDGDEKVTPDRHPDLLTWDEAAKILGCSKTTLKRIKAGGEIGFTQVGTGVRPKVYFSMDDIDEYLKSRRTAPRPGRRQAS